MPMNDIRYDVFISFKNTDKDNNPTEDSQIAAILYKELEQRGIKAFFSNVRLFQFGEAAYKDAIEKALDDSKVLVAIATSEEFLNSKWVKYERESFHEDILAGRKEQAYIVPYIKNINVNSLPRSLRGYETFQINNNVEEVVMFIIACLKKNSEYKEKKFEKSLTTGKNVSTYDPTKGKELKRLKIQSDYTRPADMPAIEYCLKNLPHKDKIYILDAGCAYGYVTSDRFSKIENAFTLGVDISNKCLEYAQEHNHSDNIVYEYLDLESEDFDDNLTSLMEKYGIDKFDIIFSSLVIHHLKNPNRFLRKIRKYLSKDGFIILRGSDDGSMVSCGDDGLINKIIDMHVKTDGISDRFNGRKLYGQLIASGYKNVKMMSYIKDTSSLDIDEKEDVFLERFAYRKNYLQNALEKDPYNIEKKNALEAMVYALDMLENKFSEESFWYCEIDFVAVAKRV